VYDEKKNQLQGVPMHTLWCCYSFGGTPAEGFGEPHHSPYPLCFQQQTDVYEMNAHR
jgi:hypothetical protein